MLEWYTSNRKRPSPPEGIFSAVAERWKDATLQASGQWSLFSERGITSLLTRNFPDMESRVFEMKRVHFNLVIFPETSGTVKKLSSFLSNSGPSSNAWGNADHASLRMPANATALSMALQKNGWFVTDQSVDYEFDFSRCQAEKNKKNAEKWKLQPVGESDIKYCSEQMGKALSNRKLIVTRFTADPFLRKKARLLYQNWASKGLSSGKNRFSWLVKNKSRPVAAISGHFFRHSDELRARIELNAVFGSMKSRGIYSSMLNQTLDFLCRKGVRTVQIRTSGSAIGVQRVWQKSGGRILRSDLLLHRIAHECS